MLSLVDWYLLEQETSKNRWNKKALEDDNKFLSEQEKIEASETQANQ